MIMVRTKPGHTDLVLLNSLILSLPFHTFQMSRFSQLYFRKENKRSLSKLSWLLVF
jgi:hypothetical protein